MDNARVAIFEDGYDFQQYFGEAVEKAGHLVVGRAVSFDEAELLIELLAESGCDVALVDGTLTYRGDGELIARLLHDRIEGIVVIGVSSMGDVEGADVNYQKYDAYSGGIVQTIESI